MSMPAESLPREWFRRVWNELDAGAIDELAAPDCIFHGLGDEPIIGPAGFRAFHDHFSSAFREIKLTILLEVASGDMVSLLAEVEAIPPGRHARVSFQGAAFARVRRRQLVEAWDCWDFLGLLERMEVLPQQSLGVALQGRLRSTVAP
jgi:hypothetical protein